MSEVINDIENVVEETSTHKDNDRLSLLKTLVQSEEELKKEEKKQKIKQVLRRVFTYIFLFILAVIMVFPFYWMIISSLKTIYEYYLTIPTFWPQTIQFSNYLDAWHKADFGRYMINTVIVGLTSTLVSLFITILAAFAFAKLKFKGRDTLFSILLATMMIPGEMFTITNYSTVSNWGWKNSYTALIVPFLVSVFYIYLLRQNFKQIPDSLYYAAKVDGCSDMKYLFKVLVPLSMPSIITITILKMMGAWNSYIWPRLVTSSDSYKLVTNGLRTAFNDEASGRINYPLQMAAVVIVSLPLFIIFVIFRKYIMRGVSRSGTKG